MALPLLALLPLVPKIPSLVSSVFSIFGKKPPKLLSDVESVMSTIVEDVGQDKITPEQKVQLESALMDHERELIELSLKERELEQKGIANAFDLEKAAYQSGDQFVARTRPTILRRLFTLCAVYVIFAPLLVLIGGLTIGSTTLVSAATMAILIPMLEHISTWLFGVFASSFLGYSALRTADKRNPDLKNGNGLISKVMKLGLGSKLGIKSPF